MTQDFKDKMKKRFPHPHHCPCHLCKRYAGKLDLFDLQTFLCLFVFYLLLVCKCVCACVCVCVYSFTVKVSSVCNNFMDIIEGTDQRSCVVSIMLGASAKILHLRTWKCHISPSKTKIQRAQTGKKTIWYIGKLWKDDIYWYRIWASHALKPTSDEKILKLRRLL